jgi:ADP-heptose:LPS heptosyltransferase
LSDVGNKAYRTKIYNFQRLSNATAGKHRRYITVGLDASSAEKCWPSDKFAELINLISAETDDFDIYLVGGEIGRQRYLEIKDRIDRNDLVFDYSAKTSIPEWIELIRGSTLHIGNDSGAIHVAASLQTPSIAIMSQAYGERFLPYRFDEYSDADVLPVCVFSREEMYCKRCEHDPRVNPDCYRAVNNNLSFLCMKDVRVDDVMEQIRRWELFPGIDTNIPMKS